jgi:hypothetical protein
MSKTEQELKQLALDVVEGKVFTDRHCSSFDEALRSFMIIRLMSKEQLEELMAKEPVMFYEYYSKAGPLSINGMPSFFSINFLTKEEGAIYESMIQKLITQRKEFLGEPDVGTGTV